jgi:hypothetical protein
VAKLEPRAEISKKRSRVDAKPDAGFSAVDVDTVNLLLMGGVTR